MLEYVSEKSTLGRAGPENDDAYELLIALAMEFKHSLSALFRKHPLSFVQKPKVRQGQRSFALILFKNLLSLVFIFHLHTTTITALTCP